MGVTLVSAARLRGNAQTNRKQQPKEQIHTTDFNWIVKTADFLDIFAHTIFPIIKPIAQAGFSYYHQVQLRALPRPVLEHPSTVKPRPVYTPRYPLLPPAPVRLGIGMPDMDLPSPIQNQPPIHIGTLTQQQSPVLVSETPIGFPLSLETSSTWKPTDPLAASFTFTWTLILSTLLLLSMSTLSLFSGKVKRTPAKAVYKTG